MQRQPSVSAISPRQAGASSSFSAGRRTTGLRARPVRRSGPFSPRSRSRSRRRSRPSAAELRPGLTHSLAGLLAVAVVHDDGIRRRPEALFAELIRKAELRLARAHAARREAFDHRLAWGDHDPHAIADLPEIAFEELDRFHDEHR